MWSHLGFTLTQYSSAYDDRAARGGPAVRISPSQSFWGGVASDDRKPITAGLWFGGFRGDEGRSFSGWLTPNLDFRVSSRFSSSLGVNYNRNGSDWQFYSRARTAGSATTQ